MNDLLRARVLVQGGAQAHLAGFKDGGRSRHKWVWGLRCRERALGQEADLGSGPGSATR